MTEVEDQHSTDPDPAADNPLEIGGEEAQRMIGWLLHLRRRALYHQRSLELGADKLDVDIARITELVLFAGRDRVLRKFGLPSGEFMRSLADRLDRTGKRKRPTSTARQQLKGLASHLVETLVVVEVFSVTDAAELVAAALNAAGVRPPTKTAGFTGPGIEAWHAKVVHHATRDDLARDVYTRQQAALGQQHPDHKQWKEQRLKEWLRESVRDLARLGYFGTAKPR